MLLRYSLGRGAEAELIEKAVAKVFDDGLRTKDLGGSSGTKEVGDKVVEVLEQMLKK
jgi:3-isopropylmalate dehydrogenase